MDVCARHFALAPQGGQPLVLANLVADGASLLPRMLAGLPCLSLCLPFAVLGLQMRSLLHLAFVWVQGTHMLVWRVLIHPPSPAPGRHSTFSSL